MSRRWRHLPFRRGKFFTGAEQRQLPIPPAIRQAGAWPRFGARLLDSRRRKIEPPWPQANQGQPWPSFTRQSYRQPDNFRIMRGQFQFTPVPPPHWCPPFTAQAGRDHRMPLRMPSRGVIRYFSIPVTNKWTPGVVVIRQAGTRRNMPFRRGKFLAYAVPHIPPPLSPTYTFTPAMSISGARVTWQTGGVRVTWQTGGARVGS